MRTFEDDDPLFAPMLNALFAAFRGTAVMSGCEASATGTSRVVSIAAGQVQINGNTVNVGSGSVTLDTGSTFDRYDLISVDASGSKIVTKGATKRKCPTQPVDTCLLAIVFVPAGATVIATGDVYDARMDALRLSQIAIDADKDWNGKSITNIGTLEATQINGNIGATKFSAAASDAVILSRGKSDLYGSESTIVTLIVCTMPAGLQSNSTLRLTLTNSRSGGGLRVLVNGAQVFDSTTVRSYDCTVQPGDVVTVQSHGGLIGEGPTDVTAYVRGTLTPIVDVIANWSAQYP